MPRDVLPYMEYRIYVYKYVINSIGLSIMYQLGSIFTTSLEVYYCRHFFIQILYLYSTFILPIYAT